MPYLTLSLFGGFEAILAGQPIAAFESNKGRGLLAYLAVEAIGVPHSRSSLAELLWSGYGEKNARASLRQTVHHLRKSLGENDQQARSAHEKPELLLVTRHAIQFNPGADDGVDVTRFNNLLAQCSQHDHPHLATCKTCLPRMRQAIALYRGDFLAGFAVDDSIEFEEWRRYKHEELHLQALNLLSTLTDAAEADGDYTAARLYARRQIDLEPWREKAHRRLIQILAYSGDSRGAMAHYHAYRQTLKQDLAAEPEPETVALYEQIRQANPAQPEPKSAQQVLVAHNQDEVTGGQDGRMGASDHASVPSSEPPLLVPSQLSATLTPFVGRADELAEIIHRLQAPDVRLLTLVGPGGMGKTRLALEVGKALYSEFADGVYVVTLASLNEPAALPVAITSAIGLNQQGGDPRQILLHSLRQKQMLLILDNFEHLLAGADLVVELLQAAPKVHIIVTSRQRLNIYSEHLYSVQPMAFSTAATLAEAADAAAVRLFVQSAHRVHRNFALDEANLAGVLRICQLVQGMPLGLEWAAAWTDILSTREIANEIETSADFLTVDWHDVPQRQRSMRAVFEWSWQLLNGAEQHVLSQLAIFRGGFTRDAAEGVTGATLPILKRLVDKSLLQTQTTANGEGRFVLHELLRQFAAEELKASGKSGLVEARHGQFYLAYLAARGLRLGRNEPQEAGAEVAAELDNVRLAWQWAATQGQVAELERATYGWWQFCQLRGLEAEGRQSFAAAIGGVRQQLASSGQDAAATLVAQQLLAKLLAIHAEMFFNQRLDEEIAEEAREAIALGAACGGVEGEVLGMFVSGRALQDVEQHQAAGDQWRQSLQLYERYQPDHSQSEVLHEAYWLSLTFLWGNALHLGDHPHSRAYLTQALQHARRLGKRRAELQTLYSLAKTDYLLFNFACAEPSYREVLDLSLGVGFRRMEMDALDGLGAVARLRGDFSAAHSLLTQAVTLAAELASPYDEALILSSLIRLHCQIGDHAAAGQRLDQLMQLLASGGHAKDCRLDGYLAAAFKALCSGSVQEAHHYAEQANQLNEQGGDILFRLVDTALILGHARAAVGQWQAATAAFQEALDAFRQLDKPVLAAEAQAGLAQIALAQGDLAHALTQVETILPLLAEEPRAGYNNPFFIYLTCFRVLFAKADPRAALLIQQGYDLLQQDAAALDDEERRRFLSAVPVHRDLVMAYMECRRRLASRHVTR